MDDAVLAWDAKCDAAAVFARREVSRSLRRSEAIFRGRKPGSRNGRERYSGRRAARGGQPAVDSGAQVIPFSPSKRRDSVPWQRTDTRWPIRAARSRRERPRTAAPVGKPARGPASSPRRRRAVVTLNLGAHHNERQVN
jgi:hypothetical protein